MEWENNTKMKKRIPSKVAWYCCSKPHFGFGHSRVRTRAAQEYAPCRPSNVYPGTSPGCFWPYRVFAGRYPGTSEYVLHPVNQSNDYPCARPG